MRRAALVLLGLLLLAPSVAAPERDVSSHRSPYGLLTSDRWNYGATYERRDLSPVENPNPDRYPQPHRDRPHGVAVVGDKAYVALTGLEEAPGSQVAIVSPQGVKRVEVGLSPWALTLHPDGRHLVVLNRFSNYASVLDTATDAVVGEIPLDFYCMDLVFTRDGRRGYVSNRYLDQVLVLDVQPGPPFAAAVRPLGGYDEAAFRRLEPALKASCGTSFCHMTPRGGFVAGRDPVENYLSAVESCRPGDPDGSLLLQAVRPVEEGGFADARETANMHAGGVVVRDPVVRDLAGWVRKARPGPGIPVGNPGSHPGPLALAEPYLFVGNQGTQDVSVIDVRSQQEVTGIYLQNVVRDLAIYRGGGRTLLIVASQGLGFGAPGERDPYGGETEDRDDPLAQFTVWRSPETTDALPLEQQQVVGPFDAVDGTAAFKMRDIQSDLVVIDLDRLAIPEQPGPYCLAAHRYEAHRDWVRFTSDSAEALREDIRGDIPPDLMRVVGAGPEALAVRGDSLFVAMSGSAEVAEYRLEPHAEEPSDLLVPVRSHPVGLGPRAVACGPAGVAATATFGETLTWLGGDTVTVGDLSRPYPDSDAERGELFVAAAHFSADGDTSCTSCHLDNTGDSRGWAAGQAIVQLRDGRLAGGGLLAIPQLRNLAPIQPFYFEGTHTAYEAQFDDAREQCPNGAFAGETPQGDFTHVRSPLVRRPELHEEIQEKMSLGPRGPEVYDLDERRDEFLRQRTQELFGKAFAFRDMQRFIGEYQVARSGMVPNPYDARNPSVQRGAQLFHGAATGCGVCHVPPSFTNKSATLVTMPALTTFTRREKAYTLISPNRVDAVNGRPRPMEPWDEGRVEAQQGRLTTFQLRGIFDRPASFLHNGLAVSLREAVLTPDHYALQPLRYEPLVGGEPVRPGRREQGFNTIRGDGGYILDTHGATSHLTAAEARDLVHFLLSIE